MKLNAAEIAKITDIQQPLALLDQVTLLESGSELIGKTSVSMNEPFFQGHFPQNPIMPGVLIIEALIQAAQVLFQQKGKLNLKQIKKARFKQMVRPGDQLAIKIIRKTDTPNLVCKAEALLNEKVACSAELFFILA